jgi:hypothetical protein
MYTNTLLSKNVQKYTVIQKMQKKDTAVQKM